MSYMTMYDLYFAPGVEYPTINDGRLTRRFCSGEDVKSWRESRCMTQKEMGDLLGCTARTIYNAEHANIGDVSPKLFYKMYKVEKAEAEFREAYRDYIEEESETRNIEFIPMTEAEIRHYEKKRNRR